MQVWEFIRDKLSAGIQVILLYVLESEGSSPGRKGFKMAVAADADFCGTIGGGIMEHKLVEKAKMILKQNGKAVLLMRQYHDKERNKDQSGMICSGSQLNAFIPLIPGDEEAIENIIRKEKKYLLLSPKGIQVTDESPTGLQYNNDTDWLYSEATDEQPVIHIIGGGHVSLALSELMHFLGFYIKIYDDRKDLNTMLQNNFANEKYFIDDYTRLGDHMHAAETDHVVIITFGYRTDKIVLKQLLDKKFAYTGLIGSDKKIETLFKELGEEGIERVRWKHVFAPIGINIFSRTTPEIAVSIAAEIIREKNKALPTGRNH